MALPLRALAGILLLPVLYMPAVGRYPGAVVVPLAMLALVVTCAVRLPAPVTGATASG